MTSSPLISSRGGGVAGASDRAHTGGIVVGISCKGTSDVASGLSFVAGHFDLVLVGQRDEE
jgi:hypothetical protein